LQADSPDGKLWPGAFTEVQFHIPSDPSTLRMPSTALIFGANGMRVAAVDANNKVFKNPCDWAAILVTASRFNPVCPYPIG
jgi:membrane fusion protein, multidrug efflux system